MSHFNCRAALNEGLEKINQIQPKLYREIRNLKNGITNQKLLLDATENNLNRIEALQVENVPYQLQSLYATIIRDREDARDQQEGTLNQLNTLLLSHNKLKDFSNGIKSQIFKRLRCGGNLSEPFLHDLETLKLKIDAFTSGRIYSDLKRQMDTQYKIVKELEKNETIFAIIISNEFSSPRSLPAPGNILRTRN